MSPCDDLYFELNRDHPELERFRVHFDQRCLVCGAPVPVQALGQAREHEYHTTSLVFPVVKCANCGLVYLHPRPDVSELARIYPRDYYSFHPTAEGHAGAGGSRLFDALRSWLERRTFRRRVLPYLSPRPSGEALRVLDVGCGAGDQLDSFRRLVPGCQTHGVEMDPAAAARARDRGHQVVEGRFEEAELPAGRFHVVLSSHVVEHVARPDLFVRKCLELAAPDGLVLLETPNTDALDFRLLQRRHWGGYHAPRHWYLFNPATFQHLARGLGAEVAGWGTYPTAVFWSWSAHSLSLGPLGRRVADRLFPPVAIFYGGVQALLLMGAFAALERGLMALGAAGNSFWVVLRRPRVTGPAGPVAGEGGA